MAEAIAQVLTSNNALTVLIFATVFVLLALVLIKAGFLSVNSKHIKLGIQDRERRILQRQTTYIHTQIDAMSNKLLVDHPDFDKYRTFWICKCVEIEFIRSIHYNHIESTKGYFDDRFIQILAIVQKKADKPFFFSQKFEIFLRQWVESTVTQLEAIRLNFSA